MDGGWGRVGWAMQAFAYGAGGLAAILVSSVVLFQNKLIYHPEPPGQPRAYGTKPDKIKISGQPLTYEDVALTAKDGVKLHAWLVRHPTRPTLTGPTVMFFQENAGNIAHRLPNVAYFLSHVQCNVFLLSYRGYGESEGIPSEQGIKLDAQAGLDYLKKRADLDPNGVVLFGRSLGGAVATALAASNPGAIRAVVLENTFTSIPDMAGQIMPFLKPFIGGRYKPLNFLARSPWRTLDSISRLKGNAAGPLPVMLISGLLDELIPPSHMRALRDQVDRHPDCQMTWLELPEGRHMDGWVSGGPRYWRAISAFVESAAPPAEDAPVGQSSAKS